LGDVVGTAPREALKEGDVSPSEERGPYLVQSALSLDFFIIFDLTPIAGSLIASAVVLVLFVVFILLVALVLITELVCFVVLVPVLTVQPINLLPGPAVVLMFISRVDASGRTIDLDNQGARGILTGSSGLVEEE